MKWQYRTLTAQAGTRASREEHCAIPCAVATVATAREPRAVLKSFIAAESKGDQLSLVASLDISEALQCFASVWPMICTGSSSLIANTPRLELFPASQASPIAFVR
jgi:hypothetical protein